MRRPRLLAASLAVAACSSDENGADRADRQVTFEATEYTFPGLQGFSARQGETIEFVMTNKGTLPHEFQLLASGTEVGQITSLPPGATARVTVTFDETGSYRYFCDIGDHASRGQSGGFTVAS